MAKRLSTEISTQTVHFCPGQAALPFAVTVNNLSQQFATFELEIIASGLKDDAAIDWYQLAPELSAKIPGGDRTQFSVSIVDLPPIPGGFVGTMTLIIRVFSLELREEDRQVVNLIVEGSGLLPPALYLSQPTFQGQPGELVEIATRVHNPNRNTANARIMVRNLPDEWFEEGNVRQVQIPPKTDLQVLFLCQIPGSNHPLEVALAQTHAFEIEAQQSAALASRVASSLTVLPQGQIETQAELLTQRNDQSTYQLTVNNDSNLDQAIEFSVCSINPLRWWNPWQRRWPHQFQATVDPRPLAVQAGGSQPTVLSLQPRRPWLGWTRQYPYAIRPQLSQPAALDLASLTLEPEQLRLSVITKPKLPLGLQIFGLAGVAALLLLPGLLRSGHRGPVTSVQFNGLGDRALSASIDQSLRHWRVRGDRLKQPSISDPGEKALRTIRYSPFNNSRAAVGLENGEIQIWNLVTLRPEQRLVKDRDDRVLDLQFSRDGQFLYSGHGSGELLQWQPQAQAEPVTLHRVNFDIQALGLLGPEQTHLAVGGSTNRLTLWDLDGMQEIRGNYPPGSSTEHLLSLAVAEQRPDRFATGDSQGRIALWDLQRCLQDNCRPIQILDQGHGSQAVQSVALSADGCYLASSGEDGQVQLWQLDRQGRMLEHQIIARSSKPINAVDVIRLGERVRILSGGEDHRVRSHSVKDRHSRCP